MCVWFNQGEAFRSHHHELQVQPTILLTLCVEHVLPPYLEGSLLSSSQFFFFLKCLVQEYYCYYFLCMKHLMHATCSLNVY